MDEPQEIDLIFQALASKPRRLILDLVKRQPGCSVNDLCEHFEMSRIGVMKHIGILVDAQLVISRKQGRTRQLFFNLAPIQMIHDRWTDEYSAFWTSQAVDLKYMVEGKHRKTAASSKGKSKRGAKPKTASSSKRSKKKGKRS